ncbi:MAG: hypothetical protein H8D78_19620 [Chloroflexi bacterium]|nr:hypothetical protein [Chloroflexota bacterium]
MTWEAIRSDPALQAIIALSFVLLLALVWGGIHNRRRAQRLLQALAPLQPRLGQHMQITWKGSGGFSAAVEEPTTPFRELTLATRLLPRETLPVLWVFWRLMGRRDVLQVKGTLRAAPRAQVRLGHRRAASETGWQAMEMPSSPPAELRGGEAAKVSAALRPLTKPAAARIVRLSLVPTAPHLHAEVTLAGLDQASLGALFVSLTELCRAAQARPSAPAPSGG